MISHNPKSNEMTSTQKSSICLKHGACSEYHEDGDLSCLGWQCYVHFQSLLEESLVDCIRRDVDDVLVLSQLLRELKVFDPITSCDAN